MNRIKNFIRRIRGRDTVAGVVANFEKTIAELHKLQGEAIERGLQIEDQINNLRSEQERVDAEADKARRVADKLEGIFS